MHKQLVLLLVTVLSSCVSTAAQCSLPPHNWIGPTSTRARTDGELSVAMPRRELEKVGKPTGHFQSAFVGINARMHDSEGLPAREILGRALPR